MIQKLSRIAGAILALSLFAATANAQVAISNSPDGTPSDSGLPNMNLSTLLADAGIGSNIVSDQIAERAFGAIDGLVFSPQIDVLFSDAVRTSAAGYKPYHRVGYYQRDAGDLVPTEAEIRDVVWESGAYVNGATVSGQKLTTNLSDFASLDVTKSFELRLSNATPDNERGGSIYGNDVFNEAGFRNIAYFNERDLQGNLIPNSYIVAWEDLRGGGDKDYQDIVIRVKNVKAVTAPPTGVPETGTVALALLGGATLLGTTLAARRRK